MVGVVLRYDLTFDAVLMGLTTPLSYLGFLGSIAGLLCLSLLVTVMFEALVHGCWARHGEGDQPVEPGVHPGLAKTAWSTRQQVAVRRPVLADLAAPGRHEAGRGCEISTITDVVPS